ncbi:pyrroline-5-carboxylate reductase [bacterium]|nr:pyrroline-5-carboxylate reductase [bacterium]
MNKSLKNGLKVGFIGCGKMASAIIKGVISSKFLPKENIIATKSNVSTISEKEKELGIKISNDNILLAKSVDVIFLATKPNIVRDILEEIKPVLTEDKLIVSIAAGVSTSTIEDIVGKLSVIRVMPNAGAMILEGMSGIAKGAYATDSDVDFVNEFLENIGKCVVVEENLIDVVTAISGSGPAFFYMMINEMAKAGEKLGMDFDKALLLASQTAIGSAKIMLTSNLTPETLIDNISTKGGCTEVGVSYMRSQNAEAIFQETIIKTTEKANALGKK